MTSRILFRGNCSSTRPGRLAWGIKFLLKLMKERQWGKWALEQVHNTVNEGRQQANRRAGDVTAGHV